MRTALCLALALGAIPAARAASFDCGKAATAEEKAVCADPQLSDLDGLLGRAFAEARKSSAGDKRDQARIAAVARVFLKQRGTCGGARACLVASYVGALEGYSTAGSTVELPAWIDAPTIAGGDAPPSTALPTAPGRCVTTAVTAVHPRLGDGGPVKPEDYDSGTAVEFANGGYQVSYEREAALLAAKPGDAAMMCLVAIPQACPPGDDRGRSYTVTDLRTRGSWTLGDSQHMCGGA